MSTTPRVVLVTGATSGVGHAVALHLVGKGYRVYGTGRSAPSLPAESSKSGLTLLRMNVDDEDSVWECVRAILDKEGRVDVAVNSAGFGLAGAVEETSLEEALAQFQTNFFGVLRVCRAVLPSMRANRLGYIINISSLAGVLAVPFQGLYSASKFAVEGLSEALRMEVRPFGVRVVLIEPGDMSTGFTANKRITLQATAADSPYRDRFNRALEVSRTEESHGPLPTAIGPLVAKIIATAEPSLRYTCGPLSQTSAVLLKRTLPQGTFEGLVMSHYGVR